MEYFPQIWQGGMLVCGGGGHHNYGGYAKYSAGETALEPKIIWYKNPALLISHLPDTRVRDGTKVGLRGMSHNFHIFSR